jgi:hypothetical protein
VFHYSIFIHPHNVLQSKSSPYHPLLLPYPLPQVSLQQYPLYSHVFLIFVLFWIFRSGFFIWEKTCVMCLSESGLFCFNKMTSRSINYPVNDVLAFFFMAEWSFPSSLPSFLSSFLPHSCPSSPFFFPSLSPIHLPSQSVHLSIPVLLAVHDQTRCGSGQWWEHTGVMASGIVFLCATIVGMPT